MSYGHANQCKKVVLFPAAVEETGRKTQGMYLNTYLLSTYVHNANTVLGDGYNRQVSHARTLVYLFNEHVHFSNYFWKISGLCGFDSIDTYI